ncbi:MAG: isochorismate synthase [Thermaurantimonas sp.]
MYPFVLYRKPGFQEPELIKLGEADSYHIPSTEQPVFVFAGFNAQARLHLFKAIEKKPASDIQILDRELKKILPISSDGRLTAKKDFIALVEKALKQFDSSIFTKVVLSRKASYPARDISYVATYYELCRRYPDAMVFMVCTPETGCWMGATPERLLHGHEKTIASMSLAGTRLTLDPSGWGDKELNEQKIVTDYIIDIFKQKFGATDIQKKGPYEIQAGPVKHLRTDISGKVPSRPNMLTFALQLHPTPAVLGSHHSKAREFITRFEGYDRRFYTGFFGFWNIEHADFFVNLRSMEVFHEHVELYAGAGITADSNPEDEWRETELKMQTLLSVLV